MKDAREREDCRLCGSRRLERVLSLPATPLANEFPRERLETQERFPLWLASCADCGHVQLPVVVDPVRLFREYVYVSGTSPVFVEHFRGYAAACATLVKPADLVVEVGSNDGTLLRFFKEAGARVLGVDPAVAIAERATASGIETLPRFFDKACALDIVEHHGRARLVVANNVFAHVDDLAAFAHAVRQLLEPGGQFIFEVSYLPDVLTKTLFDTIYHEHLSYHSVEPLVEFFKRLGMSLVHAHRVDTHGGSVRVTVAKVQDAALSIQAADLILEERRLGLGRAMHGGSGARPFAQLASQIVERREQLTQAIAKARGVGEVAGYGAPAKATTLLTTFGLDKHVDFVVDDSPHKQGRLMPGGRIPVLHSSAIADRRPSVVVILAWNFAGSILTKLADYCAAGGTIIVPLPEVRTISNS